MPTSLLHDTGTPVFSDLPKALRDTCHLKIHLKIIEGFRKGKHNEFKILMDSYLIF